MVMTGFKKGAKSLDYYADLTKGGKYQISINQMEACVALKVYDYGVDALDADELHQLSSLIGKIKDQVWP